MSTIQLDGHSLTSDVLESFCSRASDPSFRPKIILSPEAVSRIQTCEKFVASVASQDKAVYGINTGFGKFAEIAIPKADLELLQKNIILSHASGVGEDLPRKTVLKMWVIRLNIFCRGHSGIRFSTVQKIIEHIENGILACIPSKGSVGASGDLCPSAHASLPLIGEGHVSFFDHGTLKIATSKEALAQKGITPITLAAKEGLALINGTQLTTALASELLLIAKKCSRFANFSLCLSIEGLKASHSFLDTRILSHRNQPGALAIGKMVENLLGGPTEISKSHTDCGRVQDAYSLRCAPQVHGAVLQEINTAEEIINRELNSSTDNPLLFAEDQSSISGGNFHAIYTARVCDNLASALATLSNISERRIALAMSPESSRLPAFLIKNGGLNSGLMMAHVTAAALVSESKSLCFPASVDSIPTSDDREDHVSMGPGAGFKAIQIAKNTLDVIAIEVLSGIQELHLLRPLKTSKKIESILKKFFENISPLEQDRILSNDIHRIRNVFDSENFYKELQLT
jgi:histidine ammonia-lyase